METGDFSICLVSYLRGKYPKAQNEIALSYLSAQNLQKKVGDADAFTPARVTHLKGYVNKTLGNTIDNLYGITFTTGGLALFIAMLITLLFLNMLIAKEKRK